QWF
ncbi:recombination and repair protein RecT, partial [Haemophilus influenzae]